MTNCKVSNQWGVPNQFLIETTENGNPVKYFQSYESTIVKQIYDNVGYGVVETFIDENYWDYSKTTGKYRNLFLNETKAETLKKIKSNHYHLTNLNK